jgi:AcrR family transcriptional regulator
VVHKQRRSEPVMRTVVEAVADRLEHGDETLIRIPEVCAATGINYGSVYHHFGSREGVIDAAYDLLFSRLVERDIAMARMVLESVSSREQFVTVIAEAIGAITAGPERRASRSLRMRIVAVSLTRPELRERIARTQSRLTDELRAIVELGQARGWVPAAFDAHAVAVVIQALVFGRNLDDVSERPIDQTAWNDVTRRLAEALLRVDA